MQRCLEWQCLLSILLSLARRRRRLLRWRLGCARRRVIVLLRVHGHGWRAAIRGPRGRRIRIEILLGCELRLLVSDLWGYCSRRHTGRTIRSILVELRLRSSRLLLLRVTPMLLLVRWYLARRRRRLLVSVARWRRVVSHIMVRRTRLVLGPVRRRSGSKRIRRRGK